MPRTVLAVLAACALKLLIASPSAAQPGPRLEALPSAGAEISSSLTTPPPVARARRILAPGVAITASALIHVMWAIPTRPCGGFYERHQRLATHSLYAAAAIATVGVSLTFAGGFLLPRAKAGANVPLSRRERVILPLLGIAAAAGTQLVLGMVRLGEAGFCAS